MSEKRMLRINELLKRELAEDMYRLLGDHALDLLSVSIQRVSTSPDLRDAYVYVSILGHEGKGERKRMVGVLERHRHEFQQEINRRIKMRYTPRLHFRLDESIEKGDHILKLISELTETEDASTDETGAEDMI